MNQIAFKTPQDYLEWRKHWRQRYIQLTNNIRFFKRVSRKTYTTATQKDISHAQALRRKFQMEARSMMMAREAAEIYHNMMQATRRQLAVEEANRVEAI